MCTAILARQLTFTDVTMIVNYLGAQTIPVSAGCHTDDSLLITGLLGMCIREKETWVESFEPEFSPDVT